jgi:fructose transport system permease protein
VAETAVEVEGTRAGDARSGAALRARLISTGASVAALAIAVIFFSIKSDRFLSGPNFSLVLQQVMVLGTLAIGQTLVILTAGIDLSCGLVMALSSIFMTKLAVHSGVAPALAIVIGLLVAAGFGLLNGGLVTQLRLPPFIVTLGTFNIAYALTHIYSNDQTITNLPSALTWLGTTFKIGNTAVAYGSVLMFVLFAVFAFILRSTAGGRHIYAVGDNPEAARLTGIHTSRVLVAVYATAGLLYGVAALLLVGYTNTGDPQAGLTDNLDAITAVVIGGTSLFGGRGSVLGTLIGALLVGVIRNGLQLIGVDSIYQVLITGILVIAAVAVDQVARGRLRR